VEKISNIPPIASSYVNFAPNDSPVRIDCFLSKEDLKNHMNPQPVSNKDPKKKSTSRLKSIEIDSFEEESEPMGKNSAPNFELNPLIESTAFLRYLGWLYNFYGGLENYNVFLFQVDKKVKLHNQTVDTLYKKLIGNTLRNDILYTRDQRRLENLSRP